MEIVKKFKIGEVAKLLNVSKSVLLYWESNQYIPSAHRDNTLVRGRYWLEGEVKQIADYRWFRARA